MAYDLHHIAEVALAEAKKLGADEAEIAIITGQGFEVNVYQADVDKLEYQEDHGLSITLYRDQQKGSASSTNLSLAAVRKTVSAANDIARLTAKDQYAGLAPKEKLATASMDLDLDHPWALTTEEAIVLAKACEAAGLKADSKIVSSDGVGVSTQRKTMLCANSQGFCGLQNSTRHDVSCVLIAKDAAGMERDYYYDVSRDAAKLQAVEAIARIAATRTVKRLGARRIKTCAVPVVFSPELARSFFREFIAAISGVNLYRKSSFLLDSLGQQIFSPQVIIEEQPHLKMHLGSAWFDADGVATYAKKIVEAGVLQSYCLSAYSARRLGMETTANAGGVHNLLIQSTSGALPDLLKQMDTGLYVTDLLGHGGNLVTGDFSSGAFGYWVENGEIQYPVTEFTLAANLKDLYQNIVAIGDDVDTRGNVQVGSVLFEEMTAAGS